MKRILATILALVMVCALFTAASAEELPTIRVGTMAYIPQIPVYAIRDLGLDAKYGFQMDVICFPSGGPMAEALGADLWDIGPIGAGGMVAVPIYGAKLLAETTNGTGGVGIYTDDPDVIAAGPVDADHPNVYGSAETVKGKSFLCTMGNISQYSVLHYLKLVGLTPDDVDIINMENAQIYTAYIADQADFASVGSNSAGFKLADEGNTMVGGMIEMGIGQRDVLLASESFYEENYDLVVKFLKAWFEAADVLMSDQEYMCKVAAAYYAENGRTDFTEETVKLECETSKLLTSAEALASVDTMGDWMYNLIELMVANEMMEEDTLPALRENTFKEALVEALS